jgi:hypothetical protein
VPLNLFPSSTLSTPQERTRVRASVCLLTFKNKFFIISLEGVQNGGFAMNSLDENYAYYFLTFHFLKPQSLSIKPKVGVTMNLNLTTSRILVIISLIFIIISISSLFSQSQEWIGFISGKNIWCLADEGQYLWIGTGGGGLVKSNKSTGDFIVYDKWNSKLPDNDVTSIAIDKQGKKWIGTDGGLVKFDGVYWTVYNTLNSGLPHNSVWAIAIDEQGNKWIGTTEGLAKFDGVNWTIYNTSNSGLPDDYVWAVAIDGEGNKWIGTAGGGLAKFDGVNWRVYNTSNSKLPNDYVTSIVIDEVGNKWIGTDGGGLVNYEKTNLK